jgi:hypothetical protein
VYACDDEAVQAGRGHYQTPGATGITPEIVEGGGPGLMKITHPDRKNPGKLSSPFCVKVLHTDGHA